MINAVFGQGEAILPVLAMPLFIAGVASMFVSLRFFGAYKHALIATQKALDTPEEPQAWIALAARRRVAFLAAGLPAWIGVEIMAQSVAAFAGCHARQAGQPVELGFLLGTRSYQCNVEAFPAGADLRVRAHRSLQDDNGMGVFECHLEGPGIHAEARLNVFRPPEVASYLQESAP